MQIAQTIKARIFPKPEDEVKLLDSMNAFRDASNYVSVYVFENNFPLNQFAVNKAIYRQLREMYKLKSMMAQSCIRAVLARYKSVRSQLKKQKVLDRDKYVSKDLDFLWKPILFKRPQLDLVRERDYSFKKNNIISLNTIYGRIDAEISYKGFEDTLENWTFGTAKVIRVYDKWYLYISATREIEEVADESITQVVGIDRGLRQIMTTYDREGNTTFYSGKAISRKRKHYSKLRQSLQSKNTRSAKRRLRSIGKRENRWMNDINHCLSKTLVSKYGANTLFVLEDLTNITFNTVSKRKKEDRYEHHSWSFYDLEQKISYKATQQGSKVISVNPRYTSQRCPKCGMIDKSQRYRELHAYHCACGYKSNDDRVAAMNIAQLGELYLNGMKKPCFSA